MKSQASPYSVTAELALPKFRAERTFVQAERKFVARKLATMASEPLLAAAISKWVDRTPRYKDWEHYEHELVRYLQKLERHEQEISDGLIPIKIVVANDNMEPIRRIRVQVEIKNGTIHKTKKAPERPKRIDSSESTNWWRIFSSGGFWRSGVHVTAHKLEAKFSKLGGHDAAYLINNPTYIEVTDQTDMTYELRAAGLDTPLRGEVPIYEPAS